MNSYGLTTQEAEASRLQYGSNTLTEKATETFWSKLKDNFGDPMIRILCVALLINLICVILGAAEWYETVGIAVAVLIATLVSTFSEYRNENAFQKLQEEASRITCKVYRDGSISELCIDDIVVGDCVLLQAGDKVPADGVLITSSLQVNQAVLNGEAKEAHKIAITEETIEDAEGIDFLHPNKLFRGSVVVAGNAVMRVDVVGDQSVYGQIASELQIDEDRDSPLKVKLGKLAMGISKFGYIGGIAIALAFMASRLLNPTVMELYATNWVLILNDVVDAVILAVIIIVMAVPEGLPLMIAIVSALNMSKMLKDNVLVRKVAGIETAGSLNILFSDKTGTITRGHLETVIFIDGAGKEYHNYDEVVGTLGELLDTSVRYNSAALLTGDGEDRRIVGGNATERAILRFVADRQSEANVNICSSVPFSSERKYSACRIDGDCCLSLIKGAPEKIMPKCKYYYDENGERQAFTGKSNVNDALDTLAKRAIRVLALATSEKEVDENGIECDDCTLVGIVGIRDEVRPEAVTAISEVQGAGVQVVMITGDRKDTALAIAKEAGIVKSDSDIVLTSDELNAMSDEEVTAKMKDLRVVARALPSDKSRLVRLAQDLNLVVGMTGDGVNDSPALKRADVGFAMGGGTEVAKEASEIVILDDNFSSIDKAILYGRTIFNSIRKFIIFQLTINISAVLICFICPLLNIKNPLTITQILWINLVMDTLAALAFGGEPALKRYMLDRPKRRDESIISRYMWSEILTASLFVFGASMVFLFAPFVSAFFRPGFDGVVPSQYLATGYFTFFIMCSVFNGFNARTEKTSLFDSIRKNPGFLRVMGMIVLVQLAMTYFGGVIFDCYGLNLQEWIVVLVFAILIVPVDLLRKVILQKLNRK